MTILTKPFSEKKGDKLITPLVDNEHVLPPSAPEDVESGEGVHRPRIIIFPARARRVSTATTLCLLLTALAVVGVGIIGGKILYSQFLSVTRHEYQSIASHEYQSGERPQARFDGWVQVPRQDAYNVNDDSTDSNIIQNPTEWEMSDDPEMNNIYKNVFQENFEIDDDEKYEKIDVPDFRDGRSGRFIHDFNTNMTGIIDITGHRCFVMPLNRDNVLPPKSLFDLIHKMWEGYYKVDTDVVRRSMRVVIPPLEDTKSIGGYIANECEGLPIYRLEKYVGGVVKRSADLHSEAKFAQFAGNGITEFDIVNLEDVIAYEKKLNSH